ncbi:unnamed protein product, partial [Polarella glacialis]
LHWGQGAGQNKAADSESSRVLVGRQATWWSFTRGCLGANETAPLFVASHELCGSFP